MILPETAWRVAVLILAIISVGAFVAFLYWPGKAAARSTPPHHGPSQSSKFGSRPSHRRSRSLRIPKPGSFKREFLILILLMVAVVILKSSKYRGEPSMSAVPLRGGISEPSYRSCGEARRAGVAPLYRGQPGYSVHLDADGDGVACEPWFNR